MAYSVYTDLEALVGVPTLAQLTNDTPGATTTDQTVAAAMIAQADILIDSKAGQVYTVPFTGTVPDQIKLISRNLALYFCFCRRFAIMEVPKQWVDIKADMDSLLDDISNMMRWLPGATPIASTEGDMQTMTDDPSFDFTNEDNPVSFF